MAIIGIIGRKEITDNLLFDGNIVPYDYIDMVLKYNHTPINLLTNSAYKCINKEGLDLCDGIIIPGGNEIKDYHFEIIDYCLKKQIPLLGICLGMQAISLYSSKKTSLKKIENHMPSSYNEEEVAKFKHFINIEKDTFLYELYSSKLEVNSRHNYVVDYVEKPFKISAKCDDEIEAIEYIDEKNFILGVQFHPEKMQNVDLMLKNFFNRCEHSKN